MKRVETLFFKRHIETMGSYPSEFECGDGETYIVKHRENGVKREELIKEAIASRLLKKLEIPTPDVAAVEIISEAVPREFVFIRHRPTGIGFGSKKIHRSRSVTKETLFNVAGMRMFDAPETLIGICLFDIWVFNADRSLNNPNLIIEEVAGKKMRLVAIDHSALFSQRSLS
jgi:hypothetical protein